MTPLTKLLLRALLASVLAGALFGLFIFVRDGGAQAFNRGLWFAIWFFPVLVVIVILDRRIARKSQPQR
jgi:hypothetical protein